MSKTKTSRLAGQEAFAFGTMNDPVYARRACKVTVMTPRLASDLLHAAELEGTQSESFQELVALYANAMAGHWWMLTGETIVVDRNGRVIDGKARLLACVKANTPFPVVLVTGIEPEAEYAIDDRKTRSMADTVYIQGETRPQSVVHACETIVGFLHAPNRAIFVADGKGHGLDNHGISRLISRYPEITAAARFADTFRLPGFPHSVVTAARFLAGLLDEERASAFFEILANPESDEKSVPARLAAKARTKLTGGKDTKALAILANCWAAFLAGERFHRNMLAFEGRVEGDDSGRQAFPDWGLSRFGRLSFEAVERPISVPKEVADGGPEAIEKFLVGRLEGIPVTAEFYDLSPERAKRFLAMDPPEGQRNRKVSPNHLNGIKDDILADRWHCTGQSIKVSRKPSFLDGQHRCTAVVQTGKTIEVVLVQGLNDRIFPVLDGGMRKSYAHKERAKGSNAEKRGAALSVLARIEAGSESLKATPTLKREIAGRYPLLGKAVDLTADHPILPPSVAGALCTLFMGVNPAKAEEFIGKVASGANLTEDDPAYVLREKLLKAGRGRSDKTQGKQIRWAIHAWNATIEGRPLLRIKDTKGPGFPRISKG